MMLGGLKLLIATLTITAAIHDLPLRPSKNEEVMVRMRDGKYLHTLVYFPHDYEDGQDVKLPAVMDRSPYGYGDMEWLTDIFLPFGYVAVGQDMRGTEKSEGNFSMWHSDQYDSTDLGDWVTHQSWSNGEIYTIGFSADGMGSIQTLKAGNDWLKGQYVGWAPSKIYEILFPGGTYKQKTVEDWLGGLTMPNPEVLQDNIQTVHEHEAYDNYWRMVELNQEDYSNLKGPSAFWSGWYDLFLRGNLDMFQGYNDYGDESVRHTSQLLVDPCGHCLEAQPYFKQNAAMGRTALGIGQMLEVLGARPALPEYRSEVKNITFYVMSSNDTAGEGAGLYWTSLEKWPTPTMTDYYFHADSSSSTVSPTSDEASSSSYVFDPTNPVPTIGGNNLPASIGGSIPCGPMDQAELSGRSDILSFKTAVQPDALALTGAITAILYVSSDAIDTDFMVKMSDVYPTGEIRIIQDSAIRMRWRMLTEEPIYMSKGEVYKVEISLWNTSYIVAPGHSLKFDITSSNFPRFSVNANNGVLLVDPSYPGANVTATNVLYHSTAYPSKITLPVVDKAKDLPEVDLVKVTRKAFPHITDSMLVKAEAYLARMRKQ